MGGGLGSRLRGVRSDLRLSDHKESLKASGQGRGTLRSESAGSPQGGEVDASEEGDRRQGGQGGGCDKTLSEKVYVLNRNFMVQSLEDIRLSKGAVNIFSKGTSHYKLPHTTPWGKHITPGPLLPKKAQPEGYGARNSRQS